MLDKPPAPTDRLRRTLKARAPWDTTAATGKSHRPTREVTAPMLSAPEPRADRHQLADFDSGEPSLDDWLKRRAARN